LLIEGDNNAFRNLLRLIKKCDKTPKDETFSGTLAVKIPTKLELELLKHLES
jgi:hypothetical protein